MSSENTLTTRFLCESPFMWDHECFLKMEAQFEAAPEQEVRQFIKDAQNMPYKNYIRTAYWGIIRGQMIYLNPFCNGCRSSKALQIHHWSYKYIGVDHLHLENLSVRCGLCHRSEHGLTSTADLIEIQKRRDNAWKYYQEPEVPRSSDLRSGMNHSSDHVMEILKKLS